MSSIMGGSKSTGGTGGADVTTGKEPLMEGGSSGSSDYLKKFGSGFGSSVGDMMGSGGGGSAANAPVITPGNHSYQPQAGGQSQGPQYSELMAFLKNTGKN